MFTEVNDDSDLSPCAETEENQYFSEIFSCRSYPKWSTEAVMTQILCLAQRRAGMPKMKKIISLSICLALQATPLDPQERWWLRSSVLPATSSPSPIQHRFGTPKAKKIIGFLYFHLWKLPRMIHRSGDDSDFWLWKLPQMIRTSGDDLTSVLLSSDFGKTKSQGLRILLMLECCFGYLTLIF